MRNRYPGVNPHLNSFLQTTGGGWEAFHSAYIGEIVRDLDQILPPNYYAVGEKSLQVGIFDPITDSALDEPATTIPDVSIYQRRKSESVEPAGVANAHTPTLVYPLAKSISETERVRSVVIYQIVDGKSPGQPITRIELLSPANKPGHSHYATYLVKRTESLEAGLVLLEIDLLHETRPLLPLLPSYRGRSADSYPYYMLLNDPRPSIDEGRLEYHGFKVNEPIPVIDLPLAGKDRVRVDFGAIYQALVGHSRFLQALVDYARLPERFETYSEADQIFIRQRMGEIAVGG